MIITDLLNDYVQKNPTKPLEITEIQRFYDQRMRTNRPNKLVSFVLFKASKLLQPKTNKQGK